MISNISKIISKILQKMSFFRRTNFSRKRKGHIQGEMNYFFTQSLFPRIFETISNRFIN